MTNFRVEPSTSRMSAIVSSPRACNARLTTVRAAPCVATSTSPDSPHRTRGALSPRRPSSAFRDSAAASSSAAVVSGHVPYLSSFGVDGNRELYVMDADGSHQHRLTPVVG